MVESEIIIEKDKCEICGYSKHKGSLHIHHVDGNHANNNKSNLQIICANCHFEMHHTSKRKIKDFGEGLCPKCASTQVQRYGIYTSRAQGKVQRYKCTACAHVFIAK